MSESMGRMDGDTDNRSLHERIASAANYPGALTELFGYLDAAIEDGRTLDPSDMHRYVLDLKRRYVTEPVGAAIAKGAQR